MGDLERTNRQWRRLGTTDPLWGVLSDRSKKGNRWDPDEFLHTGTEEIGAVIHRLGEAGLAPAGPALDVGCGAGRLTQALAAVLGSATGVDVSPGMIAKARELNRQGERCRFIQVEGSDLDALDDGSFAFVYCVLVLQHMPAAVAERYIRDFTRLLRPGGILVFQVPVGRASGPRARRIRIRHAVLRPFRAMDINPVAPTTVESILRAGGCSIVAQDRDWRAGGGWRSVTYTAIKSA